MTIADAIELTFTKYFNSHPHEEDDHTHRRNRLRQRNFNSHPHEEDDVHEYEYNRAILDFNSHPHEEDDEGWKLFQKFVEAFQLTSSRRG